MTPPTAVCPPDAPAAAPGRLRCQRPRLRADLRAATTAGGVVLVGERRSVRIASPLLSRLLPTLDGRHDLAEICRAAGGITTVSAVLGELRRLERHGLLADGPAGPGGPARQGATDALGLAGAGGTVGVIGLSPVATDEVLVALAAAGVDTGPGPAASATLGPDGTPPAGHDLVVVVVDDYLDGRLADLNAAMLAWRRPWMLTKPAGTASWIGPVFRPGETACWSCLAERLRHNTPARPDDGPEPVVVGLPSTTRAATGLLATEVLRATAPGGGAAARLLVLDHVGPGLSSHPVPRVDRCPACATGFPPRGERRSDDAVPGRSPAEALATLRPAVSTLTGIATSLEDATEVIPGLAYRAFARSGVVVAAQRAEPFDGAGKGRTPAAAQMSALGEVLERAGGIWRPGTPVVRARWADVADVALWPPDLLGYSQRQYDQRHADGGGDGQEPGGGLAARVAAVPEPFDPDREIDWSEAVEPGTGAAVLVPSALCFYGHPDLREHGWAYCDSNGAAAGGTWSEAVLSGFYELVERDAVALWWYNRARRPAVDLDGAGDPAVDALRAHYRALGRDLWVLDLRTDTGVVCLAAVSRRVGHPVEDITLGFGAHLDGRVALGRALDELNQGLPLVDQHDPAGDTVYRFADGPMIDWFRSATTAGEPYLLPDPRRPAVPVDELGSAASGRAAADVATCAALARSVGSRLYTVDVGAADVGLRVARVIAPGLRHFWRRLGPGRLYDTPVALGWTDRRPDEGELNPRTMHL